MNVNLLAADGPDGIERVSGMAHLTGFPVEVPARPRARGTRGAGPGIAPAPDGCIDARAVPDGGVPEPVCDACA